MSGQGENDAKSNSNWLQSPLADFVSAAGHTHNPVLTQHCNFSPAEGDREPFTLNVSMQETFSSVLLPFVYRKRKTKSRTHPPTVLLLLPTEIIICKLRSGIVVRRKFCKQPPAP